MGTCACPYLQLGAGPKICMDRRKKSLTQEHYCNTPRIQRAFYKPYGYKGRAKGGDTVGSLRRRTEHRLQNTWGLGRRLFLYRTSSAFILPPTGWFPGSFTDLVFISSFIWGAGSSVCRDKWWVRALTTKPDNSSLIPETHAERTELIPTGCPMACMHM